MKALFVTARWPDPLAEFSHGTATRMRTMMRAVQQSGYALDMLIFVPAEETIDEVLRQRLLRDFERLWGITLGRLWLVQQDRVKEYASELWRGYLRPMFGMRRQPAYEPLASKRQIHGLEAALREARPQLLFVHRLNAMFPVLRTRAALPPVVLDLDDVEHKTFRRLVDSPPVWRTKRLKHVWALALERGERRAVHLASATFVCSEVDRDYLRRRFGTEKVRTIQNSMPVPQTSPLPAQMSVLFLGVHYYEPNRTGAEFLIHEVWPKVLARHPDAVVRIAGKGCERIRGYDSSPRGVEFLGYVADIDALYARTRVVACPIFSGGGTRLKIIEAALQARPVVSTTLGAEGLELSAGEGEIALADTADALAARICELLAPGDVGARMGQRARAKALRHYSEDAALRSIVAELKAVGSA